MLPPYIEMIKVVFWIYGFNFADAGASYIEKPF